MRVGAASGRTLERAGRACPPSSSDATNAPSPSAADYSSPRVAKRPWPYGSDHGRIRCLPTTQQQKRERGTERTRAPVRPRNESARRSRAAASQNASASFHPSDALLQGPVLSTHRCNFHAPVAGFEREVVTEGRRGWADSVHP